jgi:UDP-N-acetylglucosamine/UDP-N-acetylgalactosamine diphosphorylase
MHSYHEDQVGCIVLAGGDGSRLGWSGPKGTFPIFEGLTLFQLLEKRLGSLKNVAVMTSPRSDEITRASFTREVDFFTQNMLPLLDAEGKALDEWRPNGNGEALKCFYRSGLFEKWRNRGVEFVQVILIDNPLADPFDAKMIDIQMKTGAEVCIKAVPKLHPDEKVGVIGEKGGKVCVVEYSENPPADWNLANTGLYSFTMDFIERVKDIELPVHGVARDFQGRPVIKREYFLFDVLPYSEKTEVILYPREATFAPLKSKEDIPAVQRSIRLLLEKDGKYNQQCQCKH